MSEYEIAQEELGTQPTAVRRFRAPVEEMGARLGEVFPAVFRYLAMTGIEPAGAPFARYLSMDGHVFEVEAGLPTAEPVAGDAETVASELPGGAALSTCHRGPYTDLGGAHTALHGRAAEEGLTPRAAWESYIDDPSTLPPEKVRTMVYLAV